MNFIKSKTKRVIACVSSLVLVVGVMTGCKAKKDEIENVVNKVTFSDYLTERTALTNYESVSDIKMSQTTVNSYDTVVFESDAHMVVQVSDKNLLIKDYNVNNSTHTTYSQEYIDDFGATPEVDESAIKLTLGDTFMVFDGVLYVKTQALYDTINSISLGFADALSESINSLSDMGAYDSTMDFDIDETTDGEIDETLSAGQLARGAEVDESEPVVTSDDAGAEGSYTFDGFTFESGDAWFPIADINEIYTAEQQDSLAKAIKDFTIEFYTSSEDTVETIENGYKITINSEEALMPYVDYLIGSLEKTKESGYDTYMTPVAEVLKKSVDTSEMKVSARTFLEDTFKSAGFEYTSEDVDALIDLAFESLSEELDTQLEDADETFDDSELKEAWDSALDEMLSSLKSYKESFSDGESETTGVTSESTVTNVADEESSVAEVESETESEDESNRDLMFVYTTVKVDGVYTDTFEFSFEWDNDSFSMTGTEVIDTNATISLTKPEVLASSGNVCGSILKGVLDEFLGIDTIRSLVTTYAGDIFGESGNLSVTKIRMLIEVLNSSMEDYPMSSDYPVNDEDLYDYDYDYEDLGISEVTEPTM